MQRVTSLFIWVAIALLIVCWLPLLSTLWLFDRDPFKYRTGRMFRRLGKMISRVNPNWHVEIESEETIDPRNPYVMVCNHLSNADIPVISNLPWEMKWVAKRELFKIPVVGWMMKLSGDIPVDRGGRKGQIEMVKRALHYLRNKTSVIFFPEGTRSVDGRLRRFSKGAFELAIREQVPILPMILDGTRDCLPKNSWIFEPNVHVRLKVLSPIETTGLNREDVERLMIQVRSRIVQSLSEYRNLPPKQVDGTL